MCTNGSIRKFKARFCCSEDQQVYGIDYFDNFEPVVSLTKVSILLVLLDRKQLD